MRKGQKLKTVDQLYEENKDVLLEAGYTKNVFKANMKTIMKENNVRTSGAWKIFMHKTDFTDKTEIAGENIISNLKNFSKEYYNDFRKEVVGWKNKVNAKNFSYDQDSGKYIYHSDNGATFLLTLITGPYGSQYWTWEEI